MRVSPRIFAVRWLRAVDVPSLKPQFYAYKPPRRPQEYEAFSLNDSERIERAYQAKNRSQLGQTPLDHCRVPVEEDGLFSVDLDTLMCSPTYWDGPSFQIHRALWFEMLGNNRIAPMPPTVETLIEQKWAENATTFEVDLPVESRGDGKTPRATLKMMAELSGDKLVLREKNSWLSAFKRRYFFRGIPKSDEMEGSRTGQTPADRKESSGTGESELIASSNRESGIGNPLDRGESSSHQKAEWQLNASPKRQVKVRPEYKPRKIKHLVFCVHGIGQLLSVKFEQVNFIRDVDTLRQMLARYYPNVMGKSAPSTEATKIGGPLGNRATSPSKIQSDIQVLPILWRQKMNDKINGLIPGQLFGNANLAAEAVLDFVMYSSVKQREAIQTIAGEEMRRMFAEFCKNNPEFAENPRVSVIGHSLGAVISFDLIYRSDFQLGFDVENLFTLGSPLGVLKLIEGDSLQKNRGRSRAFYNIMRLSDPVATRLEPLISPRSVEFGPKPLPGGGTNLLQQARELTGDLVSQGEFLANKASSLFQLISTNEDPSPSAKTKTKPATDMPRLTELEQFNRHGRLDFSVQETLDISLILGLAGHLMYLDNPDVVMFVLKEILRK